MILIPRINRSHVCNVPGIVKMYTRLHSRAWDVNVRGLSSLKNENHFSDDGVKEKYRDQNGTWVDESSLIPSYIKPYLKLARVDRPIGVIKTFALHSFSLSHISLPLSIDLVTFISNPMGYSFSNTFTHSTRYETNFLLLPWSLYNARSWMYNK